MIIKKIVFSFLASLIIVFISQSNLLAQGSDLNSQLNEAVKTGNLDAVKMLLNRGADVNLRGIIYGYTPLIKAAQYGHTEIIKILLKHRADVNTKDINGDTALMKASKIGNLNAVKELLKKGANVNSTGRYGTALIMASQYGHLNVAKELLDKGADVKAAEAYRYTALMLASLNGYIEIVKELLKHGANVNAKTSDGTALMLAAKRGHKDIVIELLKRGANVNAKNNYGFTAIYFANVDIANILTQIKEIEESIENNIEVNIEGLSPDIISVLIARSVIKNNINYYDFVLKLLRSLNKEEIPKVFDEDLIRQLIRSYKEPKIYNSYIKNILKIAEEQINKPELEQEIKNALFEKQAMQKELTRGRFSDIDIVAQE